MNAKVTVTFYNRFHGEPIQAKTLAEAKKAFLARAATHERKMLDGMMSARVTAGDKVYLFDTTSRGGVKSTRLA